METTPDTHPPRHLSRREAVRWGASAALVAWAVPTVVTWRPSPAHAGTPSPARETEAPPPAAAAAVTPQRGELAATGANNGLLAAAGVTTVAAGAAVLRWQRASSDHVAGSAPSLPLPPEADPNQ